MGRIRVKICGLTRVQDLYDAVDAGTDAVGMVFYPPSARNLEIANARQLRRATPAFVSVTGLFVNPQADFVAQVMEQVKPDILQFHGDESAVFCAGFGVPYIKAFRVGAPGLDSAAALATQCQKYANASAWLFDSYSSSYGGSGTRFDLSLLNDVLKQPYNYAVGRAVIIAGGLNPQNVGHVIAQCQPYAVDVSSGVESAPGLKNKDLLHEFMSAVQASS